MIDDRQRIDAAERDTGLRKNKLWRFPWRVYVRRWQGGELCHPSPHIGAVRIEFGALKDGIEDAEIRRSVGAGAWCPGLLP